MAYTNVTSDELKTAFTNGLKLSNVPAGVEFIGKSDGSRYIYDADHYYFLCGDTDSSGSKVVLKTTKDFVVLNTTNTSVVQSTIWNTGSYAGVNYMKFAEVKKNSEATSPTSVFEIKSYMVGDHSIVLGHSTASSGKRIILTGDETYDKDSITSLIVADNTRTKNLRYSRLSGNTNDVEDVQTSSILSDNGKISGINNTHLSVLSSTISNIGLALINSSSSNLSTISHSVVSSDSSTVNNATFSLILCRENSNLSSTISNIGLALINSSSSNLSTISHSVVSSDSSTVNNATFSLILCRENSNLVSIDDSIIVGRNITANAPNSTYTTHSLLIGSSSSFTWATHSFIISNNSEFKSLTSTMTTSMETKLSNSSFSMASLRNIDADDVHTSLMLYNANGNSTLKLNSVNSSVIVGSSVTGYYSGISNSMMAGYNADNRTYDRNLLVYQCSSGSFLNDLGDISASLILTDSSHITYAGQENVMSLGQHDTFGNCTNVIWIGNDTDHYQKPNNVTYKTVSELNKEYGTTAPPDGTIYNYSDKVLVVLPDGENTLKLKCKDGSISTKQLTGVCAYIYYDGNTWSIPDNDASMRTLYYTGWIQRGGAYHNLISCGDGNTPGNDSRDSIIIGDDRIGSTLQVRSSLLMFTDNGAKKHQSAIGGKWPMGRFENVLWFGHTKSNSSTYTTDAPTMFEEFAVTESSITSPITYKNALVFIGNNDSRFNLTRWLGIGHSTTTKYSKPSAPMIYTGGIALGGFGDFSSDLDNSIGLMKVGYAPNNRVWRNVWNGGGVTSYCAISRWAGSSLFDAGESWPTDWMTSLSKNHWPVGDNWVYVSSLSSNYLVPDEWNTDSTVKTWKQSNGWLSPVGDGDPTHYYKVSVSNLYTNADRNLLYTPLRGQTLVSDTVSEMDGTLRMMMGYPYSPDFDESKVLCGDGSWRAVSGGSSSYEFLSTSYVYYDLQGSGITYDVTKQGTSPTYTLFASTKVSPTSHNPPVDTGFGTMYFTYSVNGNGANGYAYTLNCHIPITPSKGKYYDFGWYSGVDGCTSNLTAALSTVLTATNTKSLQYFTQVDFDLSNVEVGDYFTINMYHTGSISISASGAAKGMDFVGCSFSGVPYIWTTCHSTTTTAGISDTRYLCTVFSFYNTKSLMCTPLVSM